MEGIGACEWTRNFQNNYFWGLCACHPSVYPDQEGPELWILHLNQRILASISQFEQVDFFRVYKHLNSVADEPAKKSAIMTPNVIEMNHSLGFSPIP